MIRIVCSVGVQQCGGGGREGGEAVFLLSSISPSGLMAEPAAPLGPRGVRQPPSWCDASLPLTQIHPPPGCMRQKFSFGLRPSLQKVPVNCTCYLEWTAH